MDNQLDLANYSRRDFVKLGIGSFATLSILNPEISNAQNEKKSFTFVETTESQWDNGYDSVSNFLRFGTMRAESVKDLVDKALANFKEGDCIQKIVIIGHGAPGTISVGNGQCGTDRNKEINGRNEDVWGPQLDRLRCKFCEGGVVYLRGCNVGAEAAGARKLFRIAQRLGCATVQAPSGVCNPLYTTGDDQEVKPGATEPPAAIPNPDTGKKKKKGNGEFNTIRAGVSVDNSIEFDPSQIVAARVLPRVLGEPFSIELVPSNGTDLPSDMVELLADGLADAPPQWLPEHGFSLDAFLQLKISQNSSETWVTPGALVGGDRYYSPFAGDTTITYVLPDDLVTRLQEFTGSPV